MKALEDKLMGEEALEFQKLMIEGFSELEISLTVEQVKQFYVYYNLLIEWNKIMNLTAITKLRDVVLKHFIDSLSLVKAVDDLGQKSLSIIDVGTGAGFPGIPIKIVFPDIHLTLLDSLKKRVKFLEEVSRSLQLKNVKMIHGRAEDYGKNMEFRESFDYCVSRAVANLSVLSEYCIPFVKVNGVFISYKAGGIEEELKQSEIAIKKLSGEIENVTVFKLPGQELDRTLVKIRKIRNLDMKYPRKAGIPVKEPLG